MHDLIIPQVIRYPLRPQWKINRAQEFHLIRTWICEFVNDLSHKSPLLGGAANSIIPPLVAKCGKLRKWKVIPLLSGGTALALCYRLRKPSKHFQVWWRYSAIFTPILGCLVCLPYLINSFVFILKSNIFFWRF